MSLISSIQKNNLHIYKLLELFILKIKIFEKI